MTGIGDQKLGDREIVDDDPASDPHTDGRRSGTSIRHIDPIICIFYHVFDSISTWLHIEMTSMHYRHAT
jgi:hypothetical protein